MSRKSETTKTRERTVLHRAVVDHGGVVHMAPTGATAFCWQWTARSFVLVRSGRLSVRFLTTRATLPWAECRASGGQDCLPVTAAILSGSEIDVQAVCLQPTSWIELDPKAFIDLVDRDIAFRRALFSQHAARLPGFFRRVSGKGIDSNDQRLAAWLIANEASGLVAATHGDIAADLVTAREVVSRRLKGFAEKGWITQRRGCIAIEAAGALSRVARGSSNWSCPDKRSRRKPR
ncbi:Crp/Fnr family transcriptional regulator [Rhodobacteraceae bacterium D3-12]|nr:Crp/Fnr family transcriptional regulator [Rhodobacteraceae bacterium D3-12]